MPQLDGYPAADALTGEEILAFKQGGHTKSGTTGSLAQLMQAGLLPVVQQMIADAIAGLGPVTPPGVGTPLTFFDGTAASFFDGTAIQFSA